MVVLIIADFHGLESVAMIGVLQGQYGLALLFSAIYIILQCHFQCDFHRDTAGIGEKAIV